MADPPTLKSARGHVAHFERLIAQWTHRRDHGDAVPDAESLTRWIKGAEVDLKAWRERLESAEARENGVTRSG